jgi:hypothetical protein
MWTYLPSKRPSIANGTEIKGVAAAICGRAIVLREGGGGEESGGQERFHTRTSAVRSPVYERLQSLLAIFFFDD